MYCRFAVSPKGKSPRDAARMPKIRDALTQWRPVMAVLGAAMVLGACQSQSISQPAKLKTETPAGNFLAARQALYFNDVEQSADFFLQTLKNDSSNINLLRQSFITQYYYGDIERAAALGRQLESLNVTMPLSHEPAIALAIRDNDWDAVLVLADKIAETSSSIGMAGIIKGWALVGNGQGGAGISAVLEAGRTQKDLEYGMPAHFRLHAALMAEAIGNNNEAIQRAGGLATEPLSIQSTFQLAELLARDDQIDAALSVLDDRLSRRYNMPQINNIITNLPATPPPTLVQNIAAGIVDTALAGNVGEERRLFAARLRFALFLDPENDLAQFLLAQQFWDLDKTTEALSHFSKINPSGMMGRPAALALMDIASDQEDFGKAIKIVSALIKASPDDGYLYKVLGDTYRRDGNYAKGRAAYYQSIDNGYRSSGLLRNLGITLERLGVDEEAEQQLRASLEINPDDPFTLNYLGYWWAEEGRNLDEAIAFIERAVELRPESGFFVDSLGWVHFRLGDAEKAVRYIEAATALEPSDPEIIGHLGDVYWTLGREQEARFKWRLALSFARSEKEAKKLKNKIANGYRAAEFDG
ncbi:tetratricopeptide repeat protein [Alphaproteobacteria bacterium]|nr:tetratricopeptide repeat protein [Alphaproteobacteria bacterium]